MKHKKYQKILIAVLVGLLTLQTPMFTAGTLAAGHSAAADRETSAVQSGRETDREDGREISAARAAAPENMREADRREAARETESPLYRETAVSVWYSDMQDAAKLRISDGEKLLEICADGVRMEKQPKITLDSPQPEKIGGAEAYRYIIHNLPVFNETTGEKIEYTVKEKHVQDAYVGFPADSLSEINAARKTEEPEELAAPDEEIKLVPGAEENTLEAEKAFGNYLRTEELNPQDETRETADGTDSDGKNRDTAHFDAENRTAKAVKVAKTAETAENKTAAAKAAKENESASLTINWIDNNNVKRPKASDLAEKYILLVQFGFLNAGGAVTDWKTLTDDNREDLGIKQEKSAWITEKNGKYQANPNFPKSIKSTETDSEDPDKPENNKPISYRVIINPEIIEPGTDGQENAPLNALSELGYVYRAKADGGSSSDLPHYFVKTIDFTGEIVLRNGAAEPIADETLTSVFADKFTIGGKAYGSGESGGSGNTEKEVPADYIGNSKLTVEKNNGTDNKGEKTYKFTQALPEFTLDNKVITYKLAVKGEGAPNPDNPAETPAEPSIIGIEDEQYKAEYDNRNAANHGTDADGCYREGMVILTRTGTTTYEAYKDWLDTDSSKRPTATMTLWRYTDKEGSDYQTAAMVMENKEAITVTLDKNNSNSPNEKDDPDERKAFGVMADPKGENSGELGELKELPKYDNDGYEYIYLMRESLGSGDVPYEQVFGQVSSDGTVMDMLPQSVEKRDSDDKSLYNGGTLSNRLSGTVTVKQKKSWKAAAVQDLISGVKVTLTMYSRPKALQEETSAEGGTSAPDADNNEKWSEAKDSSGNIVTAELSNFYGEEMTKTAEQSMPKFDHLGRELEYRWEETGISNNGTPVTLEESSDPAHPDQKEFTLNLGKTAEEKQEYHFISAYENKKVGEDGQTGEKILVNRLVGTTRYTVKKVWKDSDGNILSKDYNGSPAVPEAGINVQLYQDGTKVDKDGNPVNGTGQDGKVSITNEWLEADKADPYQWIYVFENLPKYDQDGHEYIYMAREENVSGWNTDSTYNPRDGKGQLEITYHPNKDSSQEVQTDPLNLLLVNTPPGLGNEISLEKEWLDDGNVNNRPNVTAELIAQDKIWAVTFQKAASGGTDGGEDSGEINGTAVKEGTNPSYVIDKAVLVEKGDVAMENITLSAQDNWYKEVKNVPYPFAFQDGDIADGSEGGADGEEGGGETGEPKLSDSAKAAFTAWANEHKNGESSGGDSSARQPISNLAAYNIRETKVGTGTVEHIKKPETGGDTNNSGDAAASASEDNQIQQFIRDGVEAKGFVKTGEFYYAVNYREGEGMNGATNFIISNRRIGTVNIEVTKVWKDKGVQLSENSSGGGSDPGSGTNAAANANDEEGIGADGKTNPRPKAYLELTSPSHPQLLQSTDGNAFKGEITIADDKTDVQEVRQMKKGKIDKDNIPSWKNSAGGSDGGTDNTSGNPDNTADLNGATQNIDRNAKPLEKVSYTFLNLPKYDEKGAVIEYAVEEKINGENSGEYSVRQGAVEYEVVSGQSHTIDVMKKTVDNVRTGTKDISFRKLWIDEYNKVHGKRPDIHLNLWSKSGGNSKDSSSAGGTGGSGQDAGGGGNTDGSDDSDASTGADRRPIVRVPGYQDRKWEVTDKVAPNNGDDDYHWTCTFAGLPKYDSNGEEIIYFAEEKMSVDNPEDYDYEIPVKPVKPVKPEQPGSDGTGGTVGRNFGKDTWVEEVTDGSGPHTVFAEVGFNSNGQKVAQASDNFNSGGVIAEAVKKLFGRAQGDSGDADDTTGTIINRIQSDLKISGRKIWAGLDGGTGDIATVDFPTIRIQLTRQYPVKKDTGGKTTYKYKDDTAFNALNVYAELKPEPWNPDTGTGRVQGTNEFWFVLKDYEAVDATGTAKDKKLQKYPETAYGTDGKPDKNAEPPAWPYIYSIKEVVSDETGTETAQDTADADDPEMYNGAYEINNPKENNYTIVNTYKKDAGGTGSITVNKQWDYPDGYPDSYTAKKPQVKFVLYRQYETKMTTNADKENNSDRVERIEGDAACGTLGSTGTDPDGTLYTLKEIAAEETLTWKDGGDTTQSVTFDNLPLTAPNNEPYQYSVAEVAVNGFGLPETADSGDSKWIKKQETDLLQKEGSSRKMYFYNAFITPKKTETGVNLLQKIAGFFAGEPKADGTADADEISITNEYKTPEINTVSIQGNKVWNDFGNAFETRPDQITLTLSRSAGTGSTAIPQEEIADFTIGKTPLTGKQVLTLKNSDGTNSDVKNVNVNGAVKYTWTGGTEGASANTWQYTITNLDRYAPNGAPWVYKITEKIDTNNNASLKTNGYKVNQEAVKTGNSIIGETDEKPGNINEAMNFKDLTNSTVRSLGVKKEWKNIGTLPPDVTVRLQVKEGENGQWQWADQYEKFIEYNSKLSDANPAQPKEISVGTRTLNRGNTWQAAYPNLPTGFVQTDANGSSGDSKQYTPYDYRIMETQVGGLPVPFEPADSAGTGEETADKNDETPAETAQIGIEYASSDEEDWKDFPYGIPVGNPSDDDSTWTITNTLKDAATGHSTSLTVTKEWDDSNSQYGTRPQNQKIKFAVYRSYEDGDGGNKISEPVKDSSGKPLTLTVTADSQTGELTRTQKNLPAKNDAGEAYTYYAVELDTDGNPIHPGNPGQNGEGTSNYFGAYKPIYQFSGPDGENQGFSTTVTNKLETTDLKVMKQWDGDAVKSGSAAGTRPEDLSLTLYRSIPGSTEKEPVTGASSSIDWTKGNQDSPDTWSYTYKDLPKLNSEGKTYTYTVEEESAASGDTWQNSYLAPRVGETKVDGTTGNQTVTVTNKAVKFKLDKVDSSKTPETFIKNKDVEITLTGQDNSTAGYKAVWSRTADKSTDRMTESVKVTKQAPQASPDGENSTEPTETTIYEDSAQLGSADGSSNGVDIKGLPLGSYIVVETIVPAGYQKPTADGKLGIIKLEELTGSKGKLRISIGNLSEDGSGEPSAPTAGTFIEAKTDDNGEAAVKIKNTAPTGIEIKKVKWGDEQKTLPGAEFLVKPADGSSFADASKNATGIAISNGNTVELTGQLLAGNSYTLTETKAPAGYARAASAAVFTIGADGKLDSVTYPEENTISPETEKDSPNGEVQTASQKDDDTILFRDKPLDDILVEKADGQNRNNKLSGAEFEVSPADGSTFAEGKTDSINLTLNSAPDPSAGEAAKASPDNDSGSGENGAAGGAADSGDPADDAGWNEDLTGKLLDGNTYILKETEAPDGYAQAASEIRFKLDAGEIKILQGANYAEADQSGGEIRLTLLNYKPSVPVPPDQPSMELNIIKRLEGDFSGAGLPGAELTVKGEFRRGTETDEGTSDEITWKSGETAKIFKDVFILGETYTVAEKAGPEGTVFSSEEKDQFTWKFTLDKDGSVQVLSPGMTWDSGTISVRNQPTELALYKKGTDTKGQANDPLLAGCTFEIAGRFAPDRINRGGETRKAGETAARETARAKSGAGTPDVRKTAAAAAGTETIRVTTNGRDTVNNALRGRLIIGETYTIREVAAPNGYELGTKVTFTLTGIKKNADGKWKPQIELAAVDRNKGYEIVWDRDGNPAIMQRDYPILLKIRKVGEKGKPLANAKFRVTGVLGSGESETSRTFTADRNGVIDLSKLVSQYSEESGKPYIYQVKEIAAPQGYKLLESPIYFRIAAGESKAGIPGTGVQILYGKGRTPEAYRELLTAESRNRISVLQVENRKGQGDPGNPNDPNSPDSPNKPDKPGGSDKPNGGAGGIHRPNHPGGSNDPGSGGNEANGSGGSIGGSGANDGTGPNGGSGGNAGAGGDQPANGTDSSDSVQTGDDSNIAPVIAVLLASGAVMAAVLIRRRKKN